MKTPVYIFALILIFASCEKEIPIDVEYKDPKLVVNSFFYKDSTWRIHLSHSLSVLDQADPDEVISADVGIYLTDGSLVEQLTDAGNGYYEGSSTVQEGIPYTIKASAGDYTSVSATDVIPGNCAISNIDTTRVNY